MLTTSGNPSNSNVWMANSFGPHGVEHAVEGVLLAVVAGVDVAVAAARAELEVVDLHLVATWSEPLDEQVGFGVGAEHGGDGGVELALEVDERHAFGCGHGEWVGAHRRLLLGGWSGWAGGSAPAIVASSPSRVRNCCSWISR